MPESPTVKTTQLLEKISKNAPSRFDLYDLQRAIEGMGQVSSSELHSLKEAIDELAGQTEDLVRSINSLTEVIAGLSERVENIGNIPGAIDELLAKVIESLPKQS